VATTRSRPSGRESARPSSGGMIADHATKIYGVAIGGIVVIVAFLALTSTGHVIDAATQHFMLYYAGVFALIGLCASVALGLVATDRMILNPGHRIFLQSAHRAASFGALAFLIIHIVTEILAQRVHVLDALVPFLSPFRTFYIGLGTIASDLVLLVVITSIVRKRFTVNGNAWRWRAIHYTSYAAFVFGVWHGLLGGRPGKPYVDWSYGFVVALVALGLAVRILANSLRPKENLSRPPVPESASSGSAPMRAASMFAQLSMARAASQNALAAQSGPQPMLSAPVGDWNAQPTTGPRAALAELTAGPGQYDGRQPFYEPGYEGPPRYLGAPRSGNTGPQPRLTTGPQPRAATGPQPQATTGPMPRVMTGPQPRAATGPLPRAATGPRQRPNTGPMPQAGDPARATGAQGRDATAYGRGTGPQPRAASGPMPRVTGPGTGPMPRAATGPRQRANTGPIPQAGYPGAAGGIRGGAVPGRGTGPQPRAATGPMPRATGPSTGPRSGPMPRAATGPMPRSATGPQAATGPHPRAASGPMPRATGGPRPGAAAPSGRRDGTPARGRRRGGDQADGGGAARGQAPRGTAGRAGYDGSAANWNYGLPPWDGGAPEPDPSFRYREPGPGMPGYRGSRDPYRGGDDRR
jgi:DMSO/TMAO reductase YedYZ heme-binding membrane subunit